MEDRLREGRQARAGPRGSRVSRWAWAAPRTTPDDRNGYGDGNLAKGYKLDAIWGGRPVPEAWSVNSLDVGEAREAPGLFASAGVVGDGLEDNHDDSGVLYDAAAAAGGLRRLAARKDPKAVISKGHWRSPERRREIGTRGSPFGEGLSALRAWIEGSFGHATSFACGLAPLSSWACLHHRVLRWIRAKRMIDGVRIVRNRDLRHPWNMLRAGEWGGA